MLLAAAITITASFYQQDPQLQKFSLEPEIQAIVIRDEPAPFVADPTMIWRALGWANYIACSGAVPMSTQYRDQRSSWDPRIGGVAATSAVSISTSLATNMGSDKMRKNGVETLNWATRIASLGACTWISGWNFNRGWKRE